MRTRRHAHCFVFPLNTMRVLNPVLTTFVFIPLVYKVRHALKEIIKVKLCLQKRMFLKAKMTKYLSPFAILPYARYIYVRIYFTGVELTVCKLHVCKGILCFCLMVNGWLSAVLLI